MKKACLLLTVLLIALLFTACTDEPAQNNNQPAVDDNKISDTTPPVSDDDTAQDKVQTDTQPKLPEVWRDAVGNTEYVSVVFSRDISVYGYNSAGNTDVYENSIEYEHRVHNELYYITTLTDRPDVPEANLSSVDFSLIFEKTDGSVDIFNLTLADAAAKGKRYLGIKKDGQTQWLNSAAIMYFDEICAEVGITRENFLFRLHVDTISSIAHISVKTPFVLPDPNRELDVYEAAYKLVENIYTSFSVPAPNRTFVVTGYDEPKIKIYVPSEKYIGQWLVKPPTQRVEYDGVMYGEGSLDYWLLEYRNDEWQLHCGQYAYFGPKELVLEQNNTVPNPAGNYVEWPGTDSLNKNGFNCARVTLTRELNDGGYDDTGLVFRKDTIKYELGRSFATGLNYILTLTDDAAHYNYISYKAFEIRHSFRFLLHNFYVCW